MKAAVIHLVGTSPYSQSRHHNTEKTDNGKELADAWERRTWRNRMHTTQDGFVVIPGVQVCNAIKDAAKYLSMKIPGERNATWTKHFDAGVMIPGTIVLPVKAADVEGEELFVPSDGKPGGGSRVTKIFPLIQSWEGKLEVYIFDDKITSDVFAKVVKAAGEIIGIGRFRPRNRGYYGRFSVKSIEWHEDAETMAVVEKVG